MLLNKYRSNGKSQGFRADPTNYENDSRLIARPSMKLELDIRLLLSNKTEMLITYELVKTRKYTE